MVLEEEECEDETKIVSYVRNYNMFFRIWRGVKVALKIYCELESQSSWKMFIFTTLKPGTSTIT